MSRAVNVRHVQQVHDWECLMCVACMACGTRKQHFINYVGHDGSEINRQKSPYPDGRVGFSVREFAHYVLDSGGFALGALYGINTPRAQQLLMHKVDGYLIGAAVLVVASQTMPGTTHVLLWDGKEYWDPWHPKPVQLREYHVRQVWPLTPLTSAARESHCLGGCVSKKTYWKGRVY